MSQAEESRTVLDNMGKNGREDLRILSNKVGNPLSLPSSLKETEAQREASWSRSHGKDMVGPRMEPKPNHGRGHFIPELI